MGYEPVTYCAHCHEASEVYEPGYWLCEGCAEQEKEVTTLDWHRTGFRDAQHGNSKSPPKGDSVSRTAYLEGYSVGLANRL